MTSPADVRAWARDQGMEVSDKGKLRADVLAEYEAAHPVNIHDDGDVALTIELPSAMEDAAEVLAGKPPEPPKPPRRPETPPKGRKRRIFDRKPGTPHKRVSLESLASWAWGLGGMALQQVPRSTPVGRMLAIQAPVAGVVVDDLCRGTVVDKVLQPLARASEKSEKVFALVGPPVLVGMISSRPELYGALEGPLKVALLSWMDLAPKAMDEAVRRAKTAADPDRVRAVAELVDALFADLPVTAASPDEEAAIRRAANGNS